MRGSISSPGWEILEIDTSRREVVETQPSYPNCPNLRRKMMRIQSLAVLADEYSIGYVEEVTEKSSTLQYSQCHERERDHAQGLQFCHRTSFVKYRGICLAIHQAYTKFDLQAFNH
jgi:hypothetical protein